jgi:lysine-specific demethylase 3
VPNYVRCNGTLKIASHFPSNTVAPDLGKYRDDHKSISYLLSFIAGPKMYKTLLQDFTWTWPMHIMMHASATPDGKPGCAVWDLFRAQDAEELRNFLRRKFKGTYQHDPIHPQQFYLDSQL